MEDYKRIQKEMLDDWYYEFLNWKSLLKFNFERFFFHKHEQLKKNIELKEKYCGKRCFVIGNAPSINEQNLKLLKDEIVFMVNRAFLHNDYEYIKPEYHVIVDPKLKSGEWPVTFLDEISEKNPNVTFLLSSDFFIDPKFQSYKKKYNIYWIDQGLTFTRNVIKKKLDLTKRSYSKYVVEQAITSAIYMGFQEINFTGVEGNGLAYLLIGKDSHSYGTNEEDENLNWLQVSRAYGTASYWLRVWHFITMFCKYNNIRFNNLTIGGVMSMVERKDYNEFVNHLIK